MVVCPGMVVVLVRVVVLVLPHVFGSCPAVGWMAGVVAIAAVVSSTLIVVAKKLSLVSRSCSDP